MKASRVMVCFGTRPEAIKLAPVINELRARPAFDTCVVATAQHREMLDQVLELFAIVPDYDLNLMVENQSLEDLTASVVAGISKVLAEERPDTLIVQGDTTTTFCASLAAFYHGVPTIHVEAGLRTGDKQAPFPEEINRRLTSVLADWHFAPTEHARQALLNEGHDPMRVFTVGNTVIDALLQIMTAVREGRIKTRHEPPLRPGCKVVLITAHRRENFGAGLRNMCEAIAASASRNPGTEYVFPVHLNPNVRRPVREILTGLENVHLIEPCDYANFVALLDRAFIVLTDSGGIQEEAPSLAKPVLVMRETTERPEAVQAGVAMLVGSDRDAIVDGIQLLLDDPEHYGRMSRAQNPYGDGTAARKIVDIMERNWNGNG